MTKVNRDHPESQRSAIMPSTRTEMGFIASYPEVKRLDNYRALGRRRSGGATDGGGAWEPQLCLDGHRLPEASAMLYERILWNNRGRTSQINGQGGRDTLIQKHPFSRRIQIRRT